MKDDFNLDEFLAEREFENDDEKEAARKIFSREKNQRAVLTQKAFDRKMDAAKTDLAEKQATLAEKQATLDGLVTDNISYKGKADQAVEEYKAKTEKEVAKLKLQVAKAAELAGLDPDDVEVDLPAPKRKPEIDLSELDKKFVNLDAINKLATGHINLTLDLDDIKDVHEDLIGKKMSRKEKENLLAEYNKDIAAALKIGAATPPLMATADRLHGYTEKRSELDKGKLAKLVADAEEKGRQRAIKEMGDSGLPTPRRAGTGSVLFADKTRKPTDPPVRDRGIKLALEALEKQRAAA